MALTINPLTGLALGAAMALSLTACSDTWSVSGTIDGTDNTTVYLESQNNYGRWTPVDSAQVSGDFKFSRPASERPDIYRLSFDGHYIYFPVEHDDNITVSADLATADTRCTLAGSAQAELMDRANTLIYDIYSSRGTERADSLKRQLYADCMAGDSLGLVSYYVVTKSVNGIPVFDPTVKRELGIIGAVANSYVTRRPDDPRTKLLNDYYINNRPKGTATVQAQTIDLPEIQLSDENGRTQSLNNLVSANRAVVLNFTVYSAQNSGNINMELRKVYDELHDKGLDIYQVDVLSSRADWRHTAVNLPWTTVYADDNRAGYDAITGYQVSTDNLPLTFVITTDGIKRVEDISKLMGVARAAVN